MSVVPYWRFTCPITGDTADSANGGTPDGWFTLNNEIYSPAAQLVIAARVSRGVTDPAQWIAPAGTVTGD